MLGSWPKCRKPGCGAMAIAGKPCTDWDCPQQWVPAAEHLRLRNEAESLTKEVERFEREKMMFRRARNDAEARAEAAEARVRVLEEAVERLYHLTPSAANARTARDLHLTAKAICGAALSDVGRDPAAAKDPARAALSTHKEG